MESMRLDDQIAALRSDERLSIIAARLGMHEPERFAVVRVPQQRPEDASFARRRALVVGWILHAAAVAHNGSGALDACISERSRAFRPFAREGLLLYLDDRRGLSGVAALRRSGDARRAIRARSLRAAFRHRRSLRAPRQHPRSQRQRAGALDAVGKRLCRSARHRRPRCGRRQAASGSSASSTRKRSRQLHDVRSWFVVDRSAKCRTTWPSACARWSFPAYSSKKKTTGCASTSVGTLASTVARIRRHGRKRPRRHRVLGRRVAARPLGQRHARIRRVRTSDSARPRARDQTGRSRVERRADDRLVSAVRRRAGTGQTSQDVSRARRHGDRHGSVDRRTAGGCERAGLRSEPLLEIRRRRSGATAQ